MFIEQLSKDPQYFFAVVIVVVISICLHELAHGFAAIALGDRTPEETGHITMNPLVHMGPIALLMLVFTGISWGAMPVDPTRLRGKYAEALVAAAGPFTNLILSFIAMTTLGLWIRFGGPLDDTNHMVDNASTLLTVMGVFNLVLFALNLIPIPPLDGSRIVANVVEPYRRLMSDPAMSGVMMAVLFATLYGAGRFLIPPAVDLFAKYVRLVAGY